MLLSILTVKCTVPTSPSDTETVSAPNASAVAAEDGSSDGSSSYDADMAKEVGADDYGMREYVFAYLRKGPNRDLPKEEADQLQRAHLDNIQRLARQGKLVLAGPFMDDGDIRGIYIFAVESLEEAEKIAMSDPAIEAGSLTLELHPWYGSAALMKINELHAKLAKEKI